MERLLDALDDAVCIEDAAGVIQECNVAFCNLLNATKSELIGADGRDLRPSLQVFESTWAIER